MLRKLHPGRPWWGDLQIERRGNGVRITAAPLANTPAYQAGLDLDDELRQIDAIRIDGIEDVQAALRGRRPGDRMSVVYVDRTGRSLTATVTLVEDPQLELVSLEAAGGTPSESQKMFRQRWLGASK
jgi:predicted metalloprotease with PDZ domain